jgi:hypothetical protein
MGNVVEKVFYTEKKSVLDQEVLKLIGFKYEGGGTLGTNKPGFYVVMKADENEFKRAEVKEALKDAKEVPAKDAKKILKAFQELEENAGAGVAMFD